MEGFKRIFDLINSEGSILSVGYNTNLDDTRFYLMGKYYKNNTEIPIYTRTNVTIIEMFLQGRISVKELFLLRKDDYYYIKKQNKFLASTYNKDFHKNIIDKIKCGSAYYDTISPGMRSQKSFDEIKSILE